MTTNRIGPHVTLPPPRDRASGDAATGGSPVWNEAWEACRSVIGSVTVAVVLTVALAAWEVPTTAAPASEPVFPMATVPRCDEVHGAQRGLDASSPAEHPPAEWEEWAADLHAWAEREVPELFAGSWGRTVAFTDDVEALAEQVHRRFGEDLEVIEVNHSLEDLEQVRQAAFDELLEQADQAGYGALPQAGQLTEVTTLTRANRVRLTVADLDARRAAELTERYGALRICLDDLPVPGPSDADPAPFEPVDDADLSPDSTRIEVLVNEAGCAGDRPAQGRIPTPRVEADEERVVVTVRVIPLPGAQDCGETPDTPFTIELDEPLGDRALLDGSSDPAAEPSLDERR